MLRSSNEEELYRDFHMFIGLRFGTVQQIIVEPMFIEESANRFFLLSFFLSRRSHLAFGAARLDSALANDGRPWPDKPEFNVSLKKKKEQIGLK